MMYIFVYCLCVHNTLVCTNFAHESIQNTKDYGLFVYRKPIRGD